MKRVYLLIYMAAAVLLASSCVKEEVVYNCGRVEEGLPAQVDLKYKVQRRDVITRAAQASRYEYRVENMYVFIFDAAGQKRYGQLATNFVPNNGDNYANGTLRLTTESLNDATIVGIANVTVPNSTSTAYNVTEEQLDAIQTLNELQNFVMSLTDESKESIGRSALFMMTGYAKDAEGNTVVTIPGTEDGQSNTLDCTLTLERTDAKVEFRVVTSPANDKWQNFSFTPKLWSIHEIPQQSLLLPAETGDADGERCTYFDSTPLQFEELTEDETTNLTTGGSFVLYMPENRKTPREQASKYAQRDDSETEVYEDPSKPGQEYRNTIFKYANEHSTYAELTGTVSYIDENGSAVNADVKYIIHLGDASDANPNDYDTKRNVHYIYTVTVKGVEDIEVEVETGEERRPGHEGDVVYSSTEIFEFDSHYDRQLITIPGSAISDKMTWSVNTVFSSGIHDASLGDVEPQLKDYKWIKFAINSDYGVADNLYVKYPGDQNYAGGDNQPSPFEGYTAYPNARLLDVQQLIERLQADKRDGKITDASQVAITAFVDENLYITNPVTRETPTKGNGHLVLWKDMVDKDDRLLHIVTDAAQYSLDGNSSVVRSLYTFKQKSIRTVFNVGNEQLETAWGLEAVMETERLLPGNVTWGTSMSDGRANTMGWMTGHKWNEVLYTSADNAHAMQEDYNRVAYACLMRNRDLNGNNVVDDNEVRWYLAAIDQLTDIYLGEEALDVNARLYPGASAIAGLGGNTPYWHYASSSAENNNPWVFWSEEGASRGSFGDSNGKNGSKYAYRCIRNLGLPLNKPEEVPTDLVICTDNEDGTYTIDLSRLNTKALRQYPDGGGDLPEHDEQSPNNLPRMSFLVDDETRAVDGNAPRDFSIERNSGNWVVNFGNANAWIFYQNAPAACPEGYRLPNQRELLIMSTRMPNDAWKTYTAYREWWEWTKPESLSSKATYMCRTGFSMNGQYGYGNNREGFMWSADNGVFMLQNNRSETGYVRCVRDLQ